MKIVIVGCGGWADHAHMPCIIKYGADILACADINAQNAKALQEKYAIPAYFTDYNEMLEKTKPDAVVCLVSENAVAEVASDILQRYPVMMEKPPGKTVQETSAIFEAAKKSGKMHMVAFNRRFAPVYLKLKEIIAESIAIGLPQDKYKYDIKYINYKFHRIKRHESFFETTAIHAVDAVKFLAGSDFKRVEIKYQEMPDLGEKVANYYIYFEFVNGVYATAEILVSTGELFEGCEIHTREGILRASLPLSKNDGGIEYKSAAGAYHTISRSKICPEDEHHISQGFYNEHKHFYDCLKGGINPGNGADTAIQSVAVCDAIKNRENLLMF